MKYPNLTKWRYSEELEGLLFFAQHVEELLFDYTIDTYKVPAMNSHTLSDELHRTICGVGSGTIRLGAIKPIKEELCDALGKDPVAKSILGEITGELVSWLEKNDGIAQTKVRAELLKGKLDYRYLPEIKRLLKTTVMDPKQKEKLGSITRSFITELIHIGYSPEHIYFATKRFFFESGSPPVIDDVSLLDDYLGALSGEQLTRIAVFRASQSFNQLTRFAQAANIEIQSNAPSIGLGEKPAKARQFLSENSLLPLYLTLSELKACDAYSVREDGDRSIQLLSSLARYHVHRLDLSWSNEAVICDTNRRALGVYSRGVPPTLRRPEPSLERLFTLVTGTLSAMRSPTLKAESSSRIGRAFARHDIALRSKAPENQLLEFWSAIEVLFATYESGEEKIVQIARALAPFQTTEYAAKLGADLLAAIKKSGRPRALEIVAGIAEGSNEIEKCLALVSIKDNEPKRLELYSALGEHILLKNRIFQLHKRASSADSIRSMLIAHDRRITWQIHRIYRARNLYVHSGESIQYARILVENVHSYLDRVLNLLLERVRLTGHSIDIDQICVGFRLAYDAHLKLLTREKDNACTRDNYKVLLFGH